MRFQICRFQIADLIAARLNQQGTPQSNLKSNLQSEI